MGITNWSEGPQTFPVFIISLTIFLLTDCLALRHVGANFLPFFLSSPFRTNREGGGGGVLTCRPGGLALASQGNQVNQAEWGEDLPHPAEECLPGQSFPVTETEGTHWHIAGHTVSQRGRHWPRLRMIRHVTTRPGQYLFSSYKYITHHSHLSFLHFSSVRFLLANIQFLNMISGAIGIATQWLDRSFYELMYIIVR